MTRKSHAALTRLRTPNQAPVRRSPKRATETGVKADFKVVHMKTPHEKLPPTYESGLMSTEKPPEPEKVLAPRLSTLELSRKLVQHQLADPSITRAIENVEIASEWVNATLPRSDNAQA